MIRSKPWSEERNAGARVRERLKAETGERRREGLKAEAR